MFAPLLSRVSGPTGAGEAEVAPTSVMLAAHVRGWMISAGGGSTGGGLLGGAVWSEAQPKRSKHVPARRFIRFAHFANALRAQLSISSWPASSAGARTPSRTQHPDDA